MLFSAAPAAPKSHGNPVTLIWMEQLITWLFEGYKYILGGGNSNFFLCSSRNLGKMNPF